MQSVFDSVATQLAQAGSDARRLFHGRGHCYPSFEHLVIDWFAPVAVVRLYQPVETEWLEALCDGLRNFSQIEALIVQQRSRGRDASNELLWGEVAEQQQASESGLLYQVKPHRNQNSGLFLDMREGRQWVRQQAQGQRVLNLFAYTCSFSVAALAGGAEHVVNVDMARNMLNVGRENHRLNGFDGSQVTFLGYDIFRSWKRIRQLGPYDLIVIDPPSFQPGSFVAEKDYRKVVRRLPELTDPGSRVLACHNDPAVGTDFIRELMAQECPDFRFVERLLNPDDFPEQDPEKGLKVMLFEREK
ncbi:class I SAM-dependent methyltransferase [Marinobacterium arenosum]|uniref:class I SAM-dependent methyltransferase n=1 Tax=Marinobacterium arenosum TaxID=2862496 RepID=UPI001C9599EF|nr:class I SAM-dependent methyltransferase [Marinobacterium arenosum]MBY4679037.1 class I SAM-dependent methyltransferase [Marinobacterium arenosum]